MCLLVKLLGFLSDGTPVRHVAECRDGVDDTVEPPMNALKASVPLDVIGERRG